MGHRQRTIGRVLTAVGLGSAVLYLVWRALFTMTHRNLWLALPVWAMEAAGAAGTCLLVWAVWPEPRRADQPTEPRVQPGATDVVVRVHDQPAHDLRATLVALRDVRATASTIVLDLAGRSEVAALAHEFGARHVATDQFDQHGVAAMAAAVGTPTFALLDAGDIPTHDWIERLAVAMADERVAVVQGLGVSAAIDSAEHGPGNRHELGFERSTLNPALGRRGYAIWTGSGSLVRTAPVRAAQPGHGGAIEAHWRVTAALLAAGWHVVAPDGAAVVAHRAVNVESVVALDRTRRARAARELVVGPHGALRRSALPWRARAALLAWSVRPLSPFRRSLFLALLAATLLAGTVPFHGSAITFVALWVPAMLYTSFGLALLCGWTLSPGDRARWSLRALGPGWASLRRRDHLSASPAHYGEGLVLAIVGLSVVLVLRGISDRWTHTLGSLPRVTLTALLLVCLWTLALALDVLRVLARRSQQRRIARVVSSLSAVLDDRGVSIVDVTPIGAGLTNHHPVTVGSVAVLESAISTASGVTDLTLDCVVRNCRPTDDGGWRIGVEFTNVPADAGNALAEFCTIEPVLERLGVSRGRVAEGRHVIYVDDAGPSPLHTGRMAVRVVALLALVGTVASTASTAWAEPVDHHQLVGEIAVAPATDEPATDAPATETVSSVGVVVVGVCSSDAGDDHMWGTNDDAYGEPVATESNTDGTFRLDLVGDACWATVSLPADVQPAVESEAPTTGLVPIDLGSHPVMQVSVHAAPAQPTLMQAPIPSVPERREAAVEGVRSAVAQVTAAGSEGHVALPPPAATQVSPHRSNPSTLSMFVVMLAVLLAASIVLGSVRIRPTAAR